MSDIDSWLWEHALVQGHTCTGIKGVDGENIAFQDEATLELIFLKCEHGKGLSDYCEPCGRIHGAGG